MTKYIICLGDGMADEPIERLGNKTPLEYAKTPHMDTIAKQGICGMVDTVPQGFSPGSDVANMGILGYDPHDYYTGRAPIEAASMGLDIPDGFLAFRCNLVTIENGLMKSFTSDHISSEEASQLLDELNAAVQNPDITFHPGVSYRHIAVLKDIYQDIPSTPPHDITDKPTEPHLPTGPHSDDLNRLIQLAREVFAKSEVNQKRIAAGKLPATDIWLWSQGKMPNLESFQHKYGLTGGIVTAVDLLKGLGQLMSLETPNVEGATGFVDTNYENKVQATLDLLADHDFVYLHVEAPDECGHLGDVDLKVKSIEDFDHNVVGPILDYQKQHPDTRVLVLPDHPTPCAYKTHTHEAVPYALYFPDIQSDQVSHYNEVEAKSGPHRFQTPWDLTNQFLDKEAHSF